MRNWRSACLTAALASTALAGVVGAQRPLRQLGDDVKHMGEDVLWVWTSPVRGDQRGWLVAGATGLAFLALLPVDEPIDDWVVKDTTRAVFRALRPVRKGGALYGGGFLGPVAGAAYIAGLAFDKPDMRDAITGCGASWFANSYGRKLVFYKILGRARPVADVGNNNWQIPRDSAWNWRSFPGGHISNVMACASFFGHRFEWGAVEPVLYTFALAVGLGRFPDRAHWASDQVVGAVLGFAVGKAVADRQLKRRTARLERDGGTAPLADPTGLYTNRADGAMRIGWQFRF